MARPEYIADIEVETIEFATIDITKINTDPALLKGYTAFLEAATKAGAVIDSGNYRGVVFHRRPSMAEMENQLLREQDRWDNGKKQYDLLAAVGETEYNWQRGQAETWAREEGMPFPPEHDPIAAIDIAIREGADA